MAAPGKAATQESLVPTPEVDAFLAAVPDPVGALAKATVAKVRAVLPAKAQEAVQGGDITFSLGTGFKALVFTVTPQATLVTLGIADGALLRDMTGLLEGKGRGNRHVRIEGESDLKRGALDRLLQEAVQRRKR
jgi:hypothetical protein